MAVKKITGRIFEDNGTKYLIYQDIDERKIIAGEIKELNADELGEAMEKMVDSEPSDMSGASYLDNESQR